MAEKRKPVAWLVVDGEYPLDTTHIYQKKSDAMWWGDFIAGYTTEPVRVMPLYAGKPKVFPPRGKKQPKPTKVWIPKRRI